MERAPVSRAVFTAACVCALQVGFAPAGIAQTVNAAVAVASAAAASGAAPGAQGLAVSAEPPRDDAVRASWWDAQIANQKAQAAYYTRHAAGDSLLTEIAPLLQTVLGGLIALVAGVATTWWTGKLSDAKAQREAQRVDARHRSQLRLAVDELLVVLRRIPSAGALPPYLCEDLLWQDPGRPEVPSRIDPYYLKYDLVDTIYRFCALLGWLELYRTDPAFLRGNQNDRTTLEALFAKIRDDLAAEWPSAAPLPLHHRDGFHCRDGFVLEDDQRAIGEKMLTARLPTSVIGYAAFCEQLFRYPARVRRAWWEALVASRRRGQPAGSVGRGSQDWWIWNATRFFVELKDVPGTIDIKRKRIADLCEHLEQVVATLIDLDAPTRRVAPGGGPSGR